MENPQLLPHPSNSDRLKARGFTLVELLVTLGAIALLLGIVITAIRGTRGKSLEVVSLSNARSIATTIQHAANSKGDRYPFPTRSNLGRYEVIWSPSGSPQSDSIVYDFSEIWEFQELWPALVREVAPWPEHYPTWLSPGHPMLRNKEDPRPLWGRGGSPGVSYQYSTAFIVSPSLLTPGSSADPSLLQPTRTSMVAFPSQKVLVFDADRVYLTVDRGNVKRWPTGLADGSASLRDRTKAPVADNPLKRSPWTPAPYHDTPGGVAGRDF